MGEYCFSKTVFNKETLLKVVYAWNEKSRLILSEDEHNYIVNCCVDTFPVDEFNKDLLEQQLREDLNNQFGNLRNYIYEKAFEKIKE